MRETEIGRASFVAGAVIAALLLGLFAVSYAVTALTGLPGSLGLPAIIRLLGAMLVAVGLVFASWVFRYRRPEAMAVSTYFTFMKLLGRTAIAERSGRTEPLVVQGPQRFVRHPLYLGVILLSFGWAIYGGATFVFVGSVALLLWFRLVLIPFEERELRALFGDKYVEYSQAVPMLVPFTNRRRRT
jgi:protein-S-isoprenylcysteine O-methyltransferase Ste14